MTVTEFRFYSYRLRRRDRRAQAKDGRTHIYKWLQTHHSIVVLKLTGMDQQQQQVESKKNEEMNIFIVVEVEFRNANWQYRAGTPLVLKGLNIKIPSGAKVGIVGRTGKSFVLEYLDNAIFNIFN